MKLKMVVITLLVAVLFYHCDPTKKLYSGEAYQGEIDTISVPYDETYYEGEYDYEYDYDDEYAYDDLFDTAYSKYSASRYRSAETRFHDLIHTELEVSFDWPKAWMYGKATLTLKPYFYPSSTLTLDAKGFEIKEVSLITANGKKPLNYSYNRDSIPDTLLLIIDLDKEYTRNEQYKIYIDYIAKPNELPKGGSAAITSDKGLYFVNNEGKDKTKPMQIWTQGETEATSCWVPTIDQPNERCTNTFYITVEDKYQTLSNGTLVTSKKNADGTRTDHWKMELPHAPYLFMMAIGEYAIVKDSWKKIPVNYYVEKEYEKDAMAIFGNTPEMMDFYSELLGMDYVWSKYSQVIVRDFVSGAMENTTATIHGEFLQQHTRELLDESNEDVISHELFHHWFGDLVTCESWSNIPLNESFATYGEYLWREYKYGRDDADYAGLNDLNSYLDESEYKQADLVRFNFEARDDMFDSHSYAKGGRVLHMLRKYLGDEAFFLGLNKYLEDNKYSSVEIHDLRLAMEKICGEDLNWFFNQWFLSSGHPDLAISHYYNEYDNTLTLTLTQLQDTFTTPIYILPLDVDIYINGKVERKNILIDRQIQTFIYNYDTEPDLVNVDAEKMLLGIKSENKSVDEYVFQYHNAPLYLDRLEAIQFVSAYQNESPAYRLMVETALNDKHWSIRQFAVDTVLIDGNTTQTIIDKLVNLTTKDPRSYVRAEALLKIGEIEGVDAITSYNKALNDSSYAVLATAISSIYLLDNERGLALARQYKNEDNFNMSYTILNIIGNEGDAIDNDFFLKKFSESSGFESYFIMIYYEPYLQRMTDSYVIIPGIDALKTIATDDNNFWMSFTASGIISGLKGTYETALENETEPQIRKSLQASIDHIAKTMDELGMGGE